MVARASEVAVETGTLSLGLDVKETGLDHSRVYHSPLLLHSFFCLYHSLCFIHICHRLLLIRPQMLFGTPIPSNFLVKPPET